MKAEGFGGNDIVCAYASNRATRGPSAESVWHVLPPNAQRLSAAGARPQPNAHVVSEYPHSVVSAVIPLFPRPCAVPNRIFRGRAARLVVNVYDSKGLAGSRAAGFVAYKTGDVNVVGASRVAHAVGGREEVRAV